MFDQLYVLARGGVCIYSGPPNQIRSHLAQIPEFVVHTDSSKYAIETLIKQSCLDHNQHAVQLLSGHNNNKSKQDIFNHDLTTDTQMVLDGVQKIRQRFSLTTTYILFCRYLAYFRGHLWFESVFFSMNYLIYGFALRFFYEKSMIYIPGCLNINEDDTTMCRRTKESVEVIYQLLNNFKFNFFYTNFFLFFIVFQFSMSLLKELKYFANEHRNGMLLI